MGHTDISWAKVRLIEHRIASPKSDPGFAQLAASGYAGGPSAKTGEGDGPRITSDCQCSSTASSR
jgi:hypothetical protein